MLSPPSTNRQIIIAHPGGQHARRAVRAAALADLLVECITSVAKPSADPFWQFLTMVPFATPQVQRLLAKSLAADACDDQIHVVARLTAAVPMAARLPLVGQYIYRSLDAHFDRSAARRLRNQRNGRIVHCFEGLARHTIATAKRQGRACLLDVPSAHEYVVGLDGSGPDPMPSPGSLPRARTPRSILTERESADLIVVGSDLPADLLVSIGIPRKKIVVIPYGADPTAFTPVAQKSTKGPVHFVCVGFLSGRKGIPFLLDAWAAADLGPAADLTLVGDVHATALPALRRHSGLYRLLPRMTHQQLASLYQSCDVFVCPSLCETGPLTVYEAMAAGLPVITTTHARGGIRDGIEGVVVRAADRAGLVNALRLLAADPALRSSAGALARQRLLSHYTWSHYERRITALYRALMAGADPQSAVACVDAGCA